MAKHNELGKKGETFAAHFLLKKNHKILARNYRFKHLELDIISVHGDQLVVVEVKTRNNEYLSDAQHTVSRSKQKGIIRAANHYIQEHEVDMECRFDVITIVMNSRQPYVEHIQDAFYPE